MPELPEITSRAREMNRALSGKKIRTSEVLQTKCLNIEPEDFVNRLVGKQIKAFTNHGKWIIGQLSKGWLLINMGMGGEVLLVDRHSLPKKYRVNISFTDGSCLAVNFWWFGHVHYCETDPFTTHPLLSRLGPNALNMKFDTFTTIISGANKRRLKSLLLDQTALAGIGNAYIHDILFLARLHPDRACSSLSSEETRRLFRAIHEELHLSLQKKGAFYELDLFGNRGGFTLEDILIGYKEGKPCPGCGGAIIKIKTGSTSSFLCPGCQK